MKSVPDWRCCAAMALLAMPGCAQILGELSQQPVREGVEWENEGQYAYYVPENYDRAMAWPLVLVCHGEFPDSPKTQTHNWTELAESKGFIVAVPKLRSTGGYGLRDTSAQLEAQREDEIRILSTVRRMRGAYNVSDDRVFIYGWGSGAFAALHTGLKNPAVFRALSVMRPRFASAYMADVTHAIDPNQPVLVDYSGVDVLTGEYGRECADWLFERKAQLTRNPIGPARAGNTKRTVAFFENILRKNTWMHVYTETDNSNPLSVRFRLRTSGEPVRYKWNFGDGDESPVAEPVHIFPASGTYVVSVYVQTENGRKGRRVVEVQVPGGKIKRTLPGAQG